MACFVPPPLPTEDAAVSLCYPPAFSVEVHAAANTLEETGIILFSRNLTSGHEREDALGVLPDGTVGFAGYTLRDFNLGVEYNVTLDNKGGVTGCTTHNISNSSLPLCLVNQASLTSTNILGGVVPVALYRERDPSSQARTDVMIANSDGKTAPTIEQAISWGRETTQGVVNLQFFNYNTDPVPASRWVPPSQCNAAQ